MVLEDKTTLKEDGGHHGTPVSKKIPRTKQHFQLKTTKHNEKSDVSKADVSDKERFKHE